MMLNLIHVKLTTNMEKGICKYNKRFLNRATNSKNDYTCKLPRVPNSQFCEYHDDEYFLNNEKELSKKFLDDIHNKISIGHTDYVGWNIPGFSIQDMTKNRILLMGAKIYGEINIRRCKFNTLDLTGAEFHGGIKMKDMTIESVFSLEDSMFNVDAESYAEFRNCRFKYAEFSNANFNSFLFEDCFLNYSEFSFSIFHKLVKINSCKFIDQAIFGGTEYNDGIELSHTVFQDEAMFNEVDFKKPSKFYHITFREQQRVMFNTDLSNVSFTYTDISRIEFTGKTKWKEDGGFDIFDARELIHNPHDSDLSTVLATYRNLRENYEFRLMYEEAGKFFVKEMELQRNYSYDQNDNITKEKKWIKRNFSLANCYNILSEYGQHFGRISSWCALVFGISMGAFFVFPDTNTLNNDMPLGDIDYAAKISDELGYRLMLALERTFEAFFQVEQNGLPEYAVRIASIPLLGMMFVVLKRRFERRFRH